MALFDVALKRLRAEPGPATPGQIRQWSNEAQMFPVRNHPCRRARIAYNRRLRTTTRRENHQ